MKLFRAVAREGFDEHHIHRRHPGRRLPSNIPYFIDNLWEYARWEGMPSRRHSTYASPTPELALKNASAGSLEMHEYVACELRFDREPKMLQLNVEDARDHDDVRALKKLLAKKLPKDWAEMDLEDKRGLEPLFMPGVSKQEMKRRLDWDPLLEDIVTSAMPLIKLWSTVQDGVNSMGELFFEIEEDNFYTLRPV
jgi:hypothetical protein